MFNVPTAKSKATLGHKLPPGRKRVAYTKLLMGMFYLGLFVVFGAKHNFATALEPWFATRNVLVRYVSVNQYRCPLGL